MYVYYQCMYREQILQFNKNNYVLNKNNLDILNESSRLHLYTLLNIVQLFTNAHYFDSVFDSFIIMTFIILYIRGQEQSWGNWRVLIFSVVLKSSVRVWILIQCKIRWIHKTDLPIPSYNRGLQ